MMNIPLYPLRFEPICKSALWGGQRLSDWFGPGTSPDAPLAEAWVLSDQGENLSRVGEGPLKGQTLRQLIEQAGHRLLGRANQPGRRFPLLLKFIDAQQSLSVQVHPADHHTHLVPAGEGGKTEAWVVLHAEPESRVWAGLRPGVGPDELRHALAAGTVANCLHSFRPRQGDCIFLRAGTVHALGGGVVLFEIQQTSDSTFRLFDWNRVDPRTGQARPLHIEQALACIDFSAGPCDPVSPRIEEGHPVHREQLVSCPYFTLWRWQGERTFRIGQPNSCRLLIGVEGEAILESQGGSWQLHQGTVLFLPAEMGPCLCHPAARVTILEGALPD